MFLQLEVFLANTSFVILLVTMFYYWYILSSFFPASFSRPNELSSDNLQGLGSSIELSQSRESFTEAKNSLRSSWGTENSKDSALLLVGAEKTLIATTVTENKKSLLIPKITSFISFCSLLLLLVLRWKEFGHFPLSNLYESLIFLCLCCISVHFLTQYLFGLEKTGSTLLAAFFGAITSSSALCINAFASFSLPEEMLHGSALVPALQSNWLMMHVTVMITSYAALIIGSLFSIAYLIISYVLQSVTASSWMTQNLTTTLDNLSYRVIGLGFPLLTIGILSGAVWANEAWGSYWSWDPKETWALLTWLVFAIYLHTRITRGWEGRKSAIMASLGFITVWICFLGVNLLGEGLHSYGFVQNSL